MKKTNEELISINSINRQIKNLRNKKRRLEEKELKRKKGLERFNFHISYSVELNEEEIYPDGDGPDNPTVQDVLQILRDYKNDAEIVEDWCLTPDESNNVVLVIAAIEKTGNEKD